MDKEVRFDIYCNHCKYEYLPSFELPCDECLGCPSNEDSHCPVYFKRNPGKPFIYYLLPDPNVLRWTLERSKSEKWKDTEPTANDLKLYFNKKGEDYYEKGEI